MTWSFSQQQIGTNLGRSYDYYQSVLPEKILLEELCEDRCWPLPTYETKYTTVKIHNSTQYIITCILRSNKAIGVNYRKDIATSLAALKMLQILEEEQKQIITYDDQCLISLRLNKRITDLPCMSQKRKDLIARSTINPELIRYECSVEGQSKENVKQQIRQSNH